jgi:DNA-binding transcriptional ArsR family regulator
MTPTERRALHPAAVVEAWEWLDTYARHWATTGRDWQTLDNLGGSDRVTAEAHLATLREAGLVETDGGFRGNFIKRQL